MDSIQPITWIIIFTLFDFLDILSIFLFEKGRYALDSDASTLHLDVEFHGYLRDCNVIHQQIHHQPCTPALCHRE